MLKSELGLSLLSIDERVDKDPDKRRRELEQLRFGALNQIVKGPFGSASQMRIWLGCIRVK
jgi:hypothetical protein